MAPVYKFSNAGFLGRTYKSVLAENSVFNPIPPVPDSSFDLLQTYTLTSASGNLAFTNLVSSYAGTYQHLQLRLLVRTSRVDPDDQVMTRFNDDSTTSYSAHRLFTSGSTPRSSGGGSQNIANLMVCTGANNTANLFTPAIIDIVDPFETTKYKTVRSFHGHAGSGKYVALFSYNWRKTEAVDSIRFLKDNNDFVAGSQFSLYGIKAA